ncbi:hypothetical protein [Litorimonas sp. WD9-15]|uniref:hypothetical protein n=1 Tax=Litorimonas sp. WD9-15 TaxID=3418716 RepID=UPI003D028A3C
MPYAPPQQREPFPSAETRIHRRDLSCGKPAFIWGGIATRSRKTLIAASCWTLANASAQADIWLTEYSKCGDLDAALARVMAARDSTDGDSA